MYKIYDSSCPSGRPCAIFENMMYAMDYASFEHNYTGHTIKVIYFGENDFVRVIKVEG